MRTARSDMTAPSLGGPPRLPLSAVVSGVLNRRGEERADAASRACVTPEERRRITALSIRAPLHQEEGALRRGFERGMLAASGDEQAALDAVSSRLWSRSGPRGVAVRGLLQALEQGSVGAAGLLAALGDAGAVRRLAAIIVDAGEGQPRRLAGLRSALVAWQAAHEQDAPAPVPLMAAVRRATRCDDEQVRYTAAFVLAMTGRREVRGLLETGLVTLHSAALLSYCVLGLREIGNGASAQVLRQILPRTAGSLAGLTHEAVQTIEMRVRPPMPARPTLAVPRTEFHSRPTIRLDPAMLRG